MDDNPLDALGMLPGKDGTAGMQGINPLDLPDGDPEEKKAKKSADSPRPEPKSEGPAPSSGDDGDTKAWTDSLVEKAYNINKKLRDSKPGPQQSAGKKVDDEDDKQKRDEETKDNIKKGLDQGADAAIKSGNPEAAAAGAAYKTANTLTGGAVGDVAAGVATKFMTKEQEEQLANSGGGGGPKPPGPKPPGMG